MKKLIVTEFISVDGVVEAPGGEAGYKHSGWVFGFGHPEDQNRYKLEETLEADSLLLGRVTYEGFAGAWPERSGEFADKMNAMPKYVVSSTLTDPQWENTTVLEGPVEQSVAELKQGDGGPILVAGSRTLAQSLLRHGLADEWRLMVFPVVLGSGARLFPDDAAEKAELELAETLPFSNGAVLLTYRAG